jgi:urea carboxylase-associated protein 2
MTIPLTEEKRATIEANRKRYEELKAGAQWKVSKALPGQTALGESPIPEGSILTKVTVPGGWYWHGELKRGEAIRILNLTGTSSVSLLAWNKHETAERLNYADTVKLQWNANLQKGRILLSDMGRVLLSIIEDTCFAHDALVGGSTSQSNAAKYQGGPYRNTRDNFILAAGKLGLDRRDLPPCITFFAPVAVDEKGRFVWNENLRKVGDFVDLRAEMDLLIAISNCPHSVDPASAYSPGPIDIITFRSPPISPDDFCRTGTEEAVRAFENTDALFKV